MRRRAFIGLVGGAMAAWPLAARAQQPGKIARIGYLAINLAVSPYQLAAFRRGMLDLGWVEGRSLVIEVRDAEGKPERLAALAAELVALKVDVILAAPSVSAFAAKQATATIPVVFTAATDPVGSGLVASLARPGGNVTGFSLLAADLVGKGLELLTQLVPGAGAVAVLWQPAGHNGDTDRDMLKQVEETARALGRRLQFAEVKGPDDLDPVFADIARKGADALLVLPATMFNQQRGRLVDLTAKNRLPALYPWREVVDAGGLMSYGANLADIFRRSAVYVDKILKGAKPADLPVEQPTRFELVINAKTAKALGLEIPVLLQARADEVIE